MVTTVAALTVCLGLPTLAAAGSPALSVDPRVVPGVDGRSLPGAYAVLHAHGLRVTFTHAFTVDWSGECIPVVTSSTPGPGISVPRDFTIVLSTRTLLCAVASPAVPVPLPGPYRVPSFVGKPLSVAIGWVKAHHLLWAATIPALDDGPAPSLYANYQIARQKPQPGAKLTVGDRVRGGWQPTPLQLTVRALTRSP